MKKVYIIFPADYGKTVWDKNCKVFENEKMAFDYMTRLCEQTNKFYYVHEVEIEKN